MICSNRTEKQETIRIRKIIYNLETSKDVKGSLVEFNELMANKYDEDLIVLVLQKLHNLLHEAYDIEYINLIIGALHTEKTIDELFKIFFSFENKEDFAEVIIGLRSSRKMFLFKYLRELRTNCLLRGLVEEMEMEFYNFLRSM